MQSAREIQQVLYRRRYLHWKVSRSPVPTGLHLRSAETSFRSFVRKDGSTIIALGDVSGKGMKAAMNVSLIVGVLRSLSDACVNPGGMLETLNRCLYGRLQGGFVTAILLRLEANGNVTLANAGHLPPFLNQQEFEMEGALPLGLLPSITYDEVSMRLHPGDQLSIYTDGLLEARSTTGELYGFERLHRLLASRPSAQQATDAAVSFWSGGRYNRGYAHPARRRSRVHHFADYTVARSLPPLSSDPLKRLRAEARSCNVSFSPATSAQR